MIDSAKLSYAAGAALGRWILIEPLGLGLSEVWLAREAASQRRVVLKIARLDKNPLARRLFEAERMRYAEIAADPRLAAVYCMWHGSVIEEAGQPPYHVLEPARTDLGQLLAAQEGPSTQRRLELSRGVLALVATAHCCGSPHRDIKPDNVLYTEEETAVLADPGVGGDPVADLRVSVTSTLGGLTVTNRRYEIDEDVTPYTADTIALGILIFEILRSKFPKRVESRNDSLHGLRDFVDRAIAGEFRDAGEMLEAYDAMLAPPATRRQGTWVAAAAVVLLLLGAGLGLRAWRGFQRERELRALVDAAVRGDQRATARTPGAEELLRIAWAFAGEARGTQPAEAGPPADWARAGQAYRRAACAFALAARAGQPAAHELQADCLAAAAACLGRARAPQRAAAERERAIAAYRRAARVLRRHGLARDAGRCLRHAQEESSLALLGDHQ